MWLEDRKITERGREEAIRLQGRLGASGWHALGRDATSFRNKELRHKLSNWIIQCGLQHLDSGVAFDPVLYDDQL